jgi:peptidoglycan/LPS O-acetylase OafA/YrhL
MNPLLASRGVAKSLVAKPGGPETSGSRLAWLDAMRGFAALCVVFDHSSYHVLLPVRNFLYHWLDFGQYGVFVFFLVSGYIIPASLERKGSVRGFWIGRAFRLYPPYVVALVISIIGFELGKVTLDGAQHDWRMSITSWVLMMPNMMGGANVPNVTWTLSYEMVFYLLVAALFSVGVHRRSGSHAVAFGIAALVGGALLPMDFLSRRFGLIPNILGDVIILGGVALAMGSRRLGRRDGGSGGQGAGRGLLGIVGGCVAALAALVLLTVNQWYPYPWSGFTILAFMFAGTLIYRAEQGDVSRVRAAVICAVVLGLTIATGVLDGSRHHPGWGTSGPHWRTQWISSLVLAAATFGIGMLVRHHRLPRVLPWLGVISYSVYMFHPLVLDAFSDAGLLKGHSWGGQIAVFTMILAATIAVSAASYYLLEKPMQGVGRRLAKRLEPKRIEAERAPAAT